MRFELSGYPCILLQLVLTTNVVLDVCTGGIKSKCKKTTVALFYIFGSVKIYKKSLRTTHGSFFELENHARGQFCMDIFLQISTDSEV
jgi:hypothetical protein